ncbi:putative O-linked N-acetylglucosamine transferase (SPINDLY family) [Inhella inkyongensis]|uniref:protein O-GlcNAc transferase n=1 Tax=Inhella inkyongensis TaxID=392593 RepID=A0A840SCI7_9BURK|nr:tetratricopeptide repeat protein [Inhella inkyongensis]MBB5206474.1 putative O-linked N-acetylglucosamine transferase (SPINDLY family) [Inhella inkyongensis]
MNLGELMQRAQAWQAQGQLEAAAALYQAWLGFAGHAPLHRAVAGFNWGTVLGALRRPEQALQAYEQALALKPDFAQALLNQAHQYEHLGRSDEALATWARVYDGIEHLDSIGGEALDLQLHALNNSARLLEQLRRYDESETLMARSLMLKATQGDVIQHYVHIRQKQCEWPVYKPVGAVTENQLLTYTSLLAMLSASDDPALQLLTSQRFVFEKVSKYEGKPYHRQHGPAQREGRFRIGYLSGDLCMHAVGLLTAELYGLHDRQRFEVIAYEWSREDGTPLRERIKAGFDRRVALQGLDDEAAARRIAQDGVDVLVDLQGLTSGARPGILVHRPAPIQVGYLGLPATSALPGVDWILADRYVMQPDYLKYCSEKPIYLSTCYQVSDRQREMGAPPTRAQYQLPEGAFVFASFNNNHKVSEAMFGAWLRILQRVPNSVLWLLADNRWSEANLKAAAAAAGIEAQRLIFAPRVAPPDYLARFALADLVLDTFPYNAGTTASDCLWAGAPILTLSGRSYISRMCGSLLTAVGLPDLITENLADYERLAVQIGRNPARAASYKRYLREQGRSSALFDIPAIVRDIERQFAHLATQARAGLPLQAL